MKKDYNKRYEQIAKSKWFTIKYLKPKTMKKLTAEEQKTSYLRIGLSLAGITANDMAIETIWRVVEKIKEKGGQFAISDGVDIEYFVKNKYKKIHEKVTAEKKSK